MTIQDYPKYNLYGIFLMVMLLQFPVTISRDCHTYISWATFLMVAHKQLFWNYPFAWQSNAIHERPEHPRLLNKPTQGILNLLHVASIEQKTPVLLKRLNI